MLIAPVASSVREVSTYANGDRIGKLVVLLLSRFDDLLDETILPQPERFRGYYLQVATPQSIRSLTLHSSSETGNQVPRRGSPEGIGTPECRAAARYQDSILFCSSEPLGIRASLPLGQNGSFTLLHYDLH